jgi:hypothetical protein
MSHDKNTSHQLKSVRESTKEEESCGNSDSKNVVPYGKYLTF